MVMDAATGEGVVRYKQMHFVVRRVGKGCKEEEALLGLLGESRGGGETEKGMTLRDANKAITRQSWQRQQHVTAFRVSNMYSSASNANNANAMSTPIMPC